MSLEIAELSIVGVLRFAQWSSGKATLGSALTCVTELLGASRCLLVRVWPRDMASRIVASESVGSTSDRAESIQSVAPRILGADIRRMKQCDFAFLGALDQLPFRLSSGVDRELASRGVRDVLFICIGRRADCVDFLELRYPEMQGQARREIVEWIAPNLARAYDLRAPGSVSEELARRERRVARGPGKAAGPERPILHHENPAGLTRSEWKVCDLASRGLSVKSIAGELGVTGNTVRTHLRSIYAKTGVTSYYELAMILMAAHGNAARAVLAGGELQSRASGWM